MNTARRWMPAFLMVALALQVQAAERPDFSGLWIPDAVTVYTLAPAPN